MWDAWLVFLRGAEVAARLSPLIVLTPAAICYHHNVASTGGSNRISEITWSYTLYTLQKLGPSFVKFAQWAATRRDLFPAHFCERLSALHDDAYVHSWDHTEQMLIEAFGTEYEKNGLVVNPDHIIGSGSAAQ
eukprot:11170360-Ditylum_brightwellii.AAC.1